MASCTALLHILCTGRGAGSKPCRRRRTCQRGANSPHLQAFAASVTASNTPQNRGHVPSKVPPLHSLAQATAAPYTSATVVVAVIGSK